MNRPSTARLVALAACAAPLLAAAHTSGAPHDHGTAAFAAGFTHPFTGLDHLAAMVALGVWSAMTSRRVWLAPLAFAGALLLGALLGLTGLALPAVEPMIAASLLVLGLIVATGRQLPAAASVAPPTATNWPAPARPPRSPAWCSPRRCCTARASASASR